MAQRNERTKEKDEKNTEWKRKRERERKNEHTCAYINLYNIWNEIKQAW